MNNKNLFLIIIAISSQLHADIDPVNYYVLLSLASLGAAAVYTQIKPRVITITYDNYQSRCEQYQDMLTVSIKDFEKNNIQTIKTTYPIFSPIELVTCRRDYEQHHPNTFEEDPSIIRVNEDGSIATSLLSKKRKNELNKKVSE